MRYFTFTIQLGREERDFTFSLEDIGLDLIANEDELQRLLQLEYENWVWEQLETTWFEEEE